MIIVFKSSLWFIYILMLEPTRIAKPFIKNQVNIFFFNLLGLCVINSPLFRNRLQNVSFTFCILFISFTFIKMVVPHLWSGHFVYTIYTSIVCCYTYAGIYMLIPLMNSLNIQVQSLYILKMSVYMCMFVKTMPALITEKVFMGMKFFF